MSWTNTYVGEGKRIVVKIGSSSLYENETGKLKSCEAGATGAGA